MDSKKNALAPLSALKYLFKKPHTVRYPKEELDAFEVEGVSPRYRGFHTNDHSKCIGCGNCATVCPASAITMVEADDVKPANKFAKTFRPVIDYGRCCFCGQCVDVCPTGSLQMSREYIHSFHPDISISVQEEPEKVKEDFIWRPDQKYANNPGYVRTPDDLLGKTIEFERTDPREEPAEKRKLSFAKFVYTYSKEEAKKEATRCLGCGACVEACPNQLHIPEYIRSIAEEDPEDSLKWIYKRNPLPLICGEVCTHQCEEACVVGIQGEPLAIRWLKAYSASNVEDYLKVVEEKMEKPNGKKLAAIGAGPASLSFGYYAKLLGYDVTIYEAEDRPGGAMMWGIPKYRLPKEDLMKDINTILSLGIELKTNTRIGKDVPFGKLMTDYDAVFIGTGNSKPMTLRIPGEDLPGVMQGLTFMHLVNEEKAPDLKGKRLIVIGGGNVAMDVARSSIRLGAEVTVIYRRRIVDMPADPEEIKEAREEGVEFVEAGVPIKIYGEKSVEEMEYAIASLVPDPKGGRPRPVVDENSPHKRVKVDYVVAAIGQHPNLNFLPEDIQEKIGFDGRRVPVDDFGRTGVEGLFFGGDLSNKRQDIISAIGAGLRAAKGVDMYLASRK
jgi:glutamate synthase (NADPH/NADH) small chain